MENNTTEELGSKISDAILKTITDLEKDMAMDCLDYGQLTKAEKEKLIDEWLFYLLFRVDVLLFTYLEQDERIALKERIMQNVFAPLQGSVEAEQVVAIMKKSIERFAEYSDTLKRDGRQIGVYPRVMSHLNDINPIIIKGTEGTKKSLYAYLTQKNVEDKLVKTTREAIKGSGSAK